MRRSLAGAALSARAGNVFRWDGRDRRQRGAPRRHATASRSISTRPAPDDRAAEPHPARHEAAAGASPSTPNRDAVLARRRPSGRLRAITLRAEQAGARSPSTSTGTRDPAHVRSTREGRVSWYGDGRTGTLAAGRRTRSRSARSTSRATARRSRSARACASRSATSRSRARGSSRVAGDARSRSASRPTRSATRWQLGARKRRARPARCCACARRQRRGRYTLTVTEHGHVEPRGGVRASDRARAARRADRVPRARAAARRADAARAARRPRLRRVRRRACSASRSRRTARSSCSAASFAALADRRSGSRSRSGACRGSCRSLALACVPARIGVHVGGVELEAARAALRRRSSARRSCSAGSSSRATGACASCGLAAWPLAAYLAWTGHLARRGARTCTRARSSCSRSTSRSRCSRSRSRGCRGAGSACARSTSRSTVMALVFAVVGFYQYETRDIFQNPKVINSNAYAPFFRVNSVFWDPSVYGRFLVVAIAPSLVLLVLGRSLRLVARRRRGDRRDLARPADLVLAVELRGAARRRRSARRSSRGAGARSSRSRSRSPCSRASPCRAAADAALAPAPHVERAEQRDERPVRASSRTGSASRRRIRCAGVGVGGFKRAYADRVHAQGQGAEEGGVARHAGDGRGGDGARRPRALRAGCSSRCSVQAFRRGGRRASALVARPRARRDLLPLALLQRLLRGSDDVDALRAGRARVAASACRCRAASRRRRRARRRRCRSDRAMAAGARARAAHRRRRVRLRRHDGAARRGGLRGALRRVLDRDALAARRASRRTRSRARCARRRPSSASRRSG